MFLELCLGKKVSENELETYPDFLETFVCGFNPSLPNLALPLGHTLQESLDELMQLQMLSPALALRVLIQFDKSINNALATRVKTKLHFKVITFISS